MSDIQIQTNQHLLNRLPSMPEVLVRLMKELNGENLSLSGLKTIIAYDPALMLRLMSIANSPLFRQHQEVTSIDQAIDLLGMKRVRIITISASLRELTKSNPGLRAGALNAFWIHSISCALLSREIANFISYPEPEEAYVVGMLHDIGRIALLDQGNEAYLSNPHGNQLDEAHLVALEMQIFGTSHAEVGARLLKDCHLEPLMVEAILHHHAPEKKIENATELAKIVHLANALSSITSLYNHPALTLAQSLFGLSAEASLKLCLDTQRKVLDLACLLGIPISQEVGSGTSGVSANTKPSHTEAILSKLGHEINHATILSQAQDSFDTSFDEKQLLTSILQTATLIFEPKQACYFELDKKTNLLTGKPLAGQADSLRRIRFPLEINKSLLADALLWNTVTNASSRPDPDQASMIDDQITLVLGAKNLVCIPLISNGLTFGAIALAFADEGFEFRDARANFALAFGNLAATSIAQFRNVADHASESDTENLEAYKLNIRKVVHEVNNPLAIMKNYLKVLDIKLGNQRNEPIEEINVLNEEIDRISAILRRVIDTPQSGQENPASSVDVNELVGDVIKLFKNASYPESKIKFEARLDRSIQPIRSDRDHIKQVLINLIKNAIEAMEAGGEIIISSALSVKDGNTFVTLTLSDTGPGIPDALTGKLFSELSSTKGDGHAGLGLSIVASIVHKLGGTVSHRPTLGSGATFVVALPYSKV